MEGLPDILFEDNHLLIVNKRPGDIVQGDKTGDLPLTDILKLYIKNKYNKPGDVFLGLVHRLDRPVSGAVIFARTSKSLTRLTMMVKDREISKTYWAIVEKVPDPVEGTLISFLKKNESQNKSFSVKEGTSGSKRAELNYKLLASGKTYHLIEVNLITGRHHQIRAQLSGIGCPIKGDLKYGARRSNSDGSISLHARYLEFIHPVSKEYVKISAATPDSPDWSYFDLENIRK
ncbi:MAG: RNA pseudouridine synthase [Bacteroidetes bacterium HGW-Bacteroidetes-9]|nr:MAG: RNA pseudouridine synthase [Bacteroidetes bacterium HGW-Bacteroidetes-9]